jgi:VWFA-related protein
MHAVTARLPWWPAALLLAAALFAAPVRATVELRVEAAPVTAPIQAFVTVTGANGEPVPGLTLGDFTVTIDGAALTSPPSFTLPPNQDPVQNVSVVFAMDYSGSVTAAALQEMQTAVTTFIGAMSDGDFAAIVKFSGSAGASLVQPFTEINSTTKGQLNGVVMADYPSGRTNLLDALNLSINQFVTPPTPLPPGPKAVIAITDGGDNASQVVEGVVHDNARANSIPIFVIGVSTIINPNLLTRLATLSGGDYIPNPADISAAYVTISELLNNEYLLSIQSSITDCDPHTLGVTVELPSGQESASLAFVRCGAPPPPPPPPPSGSGSSGGGGGGVGAVALLGCLLTLIARRRREWPSLPAREINRSSC